MLARVCPHTPCSYWGFFSSLFHSWHSFMHFLIFKLLFSDIYSCYYNDIILMFIIQDWDPALFSWQHLRDNLGDTPIKVRNSTESWDLSRYVDHLLSFLPSSNEEDDPKDPFKVVYLEEMLKEDQETKPILSAKHVQCPNEWEQHLHGPSGLQPYMLQKGVGDLFGDVAGMNHTHCYTTPPLCNIARSQYPIPSYLYTNSALGTIRSRLYHFSSPCSHSNPLCRRDKTPNTWSLYQHRFTVYTWTT